MKCEDFEQLIGMYAGGDLEGRKSRLVKEHLNACARCHDLASQLKCSLATLNEMNDEPVDETLLQELRKSVLRQISSEPISRPMESRFGVLFGGRWNYAVLAILVIGFLAVALLRLDRSRGPRQDLADRSRENVALPVAPKVSPAPLPSDTQHDQGSQRAGLRSSPAMPRRAVQRPKPAAPTGEVAVKQPLAIVNPSIEIAQIVPMRIDLFKIELPRKPDPLVIKWVSKDPDIDIIWLIDKKGE
ncbi:MAG: zf-HC2 domain-containing protein [Acidobacteriia bacterium]|nr:zf-HC2 domain-containing protein [Terriglobia bacterium]